MTNQSNHNELPSLEYLVEHFGVPIENWQDGCYAAAHSIAAEFPQLGARVVGGEWTGVVAPGTHFRWLVDVLGAKTSSHWWLELPGGLIYDPLRWVFKSTPPYIYHGPPDHYQEKN